MIRPNVFVPCAMAARSNTRETANQGSVRSPDDPPIVVRPAKVDEHSGCSDEGSRQGPEYNGNKEQGQERDGDLEIVRSLTVCRSATSARTANPNKAKSKKGPSLRPSLLANPTTKVVLINAKPAA